MSTVTIELPDTVFSALRLAPNDFAKEMRIAAAVQWFARICNVTLSIAMRCSFRVNRCQPASSRVKIN